MFRRIELTNFKAIGERLPLELAPLTVLVGPNGTGKSAVLEALALSAQSALFEPRLHDVVLSGPLVDLGAHAGLDDYVHQGRRESGLTVSIDVDADEVAEFPQLRRRQHERPSTVGYSWRRFAVPRVPELLWGHRFRVDEHEILDITQTASPDLLPGLSTMRMREQDPMVPVACISRVLDARFFQALASVEPDPAAQPAANALVGIARGYAPIGEKVREHFGSVAFLGALRGTRLVHRQTGPVQGSIGTHGEDMLRLQVAAPNDQRRARLIHWANAFGLTGYDARWLGQDRLGARFRDPRTHWEVDLELSATGSRQALTIATLLLLGASTTLLVEEPEANLHPAYEVLLAELLAEAVSIGRQVILTTHSEVLVAAIANAVRRHEHGLVADAVAIWQLDRADHGGVAAERLQMSPRGNLDGWVRSFAAIEDRLEKDWLDAVPEDG